MVFHHTQNKRQRHLPLCDLAPGYFPSPFTTLPHHHALQASSLLAGLGVHHAPSGQWWLSLPGMHFPWVLFIIQISVQILLPQEKRHDHVFNEALSVIVLYLLIVHIIPWHGILILSISSHRMAKDLLCLLMNPQCQKQCLAHMQVLINKWEINKKLKYI